MAKTRMADGADYRWSGDAEASRRAAIRIYDGIFAETFDRIQSASSTALTDGSVYYTRLGLTRGDVVAALRCDVGAAGVATSIAKLALVDKNFNLIRASADQSTAFNSTGEKICPMSSPYTVTDDDMFYAAYFAKTATTMPGVCRNFAFAGRGASCAVLAGQTDIPATATPTLGGGLAAPIWIGVS